MDLWFIDLIYLSLRLSSHIQTLVSKAKIVFGCKASLGMLGFKYEHKEIYNKLNCMLASAATPHRGQFVLKGTVKLLVWENNPENLIYYLSGQY